MKFNRKEILVAATLLVVATFFTVYFFRGRKHTHAAMYETATGETSFDAAFDGTRTHVLVLRQINGVQTLVHRQVKEDSMLENADETIIPHAAQEKIISKRTNNVRIAAHENHVIALWQVAGSGFGGRGPLRFAESRDAGKTWRGIAGPIKAERKDDQGFAGFIADTKDTFHLVWLDVGDKSKGLRYASFKNGVWSSVETVEKTTCECCKNSVALTAQGEPIVLYRALHPRDMAAAKRTAQGWKNLGNVDNFGWYVSACPHAGGGLALANSSAYAVTWTGLEKAQGAYLNIGAMAGRWHTKTRLGGTLAHNPDIAVSRTAVAALWDEFEGERRVIKARLSLDAGRHWQEDRTLTQPNRTSSFPRVVGVRKGFMVFWLESKANGFTLLRGQSLL